ncbi:hypothetical protein LEM8419_03313 [Neolewinella maritima]|uniref:Type I-B CRISPR-associated protein Cas8b/Csh1 n=1 Tax=Neolewinella maritima TaxID=1383882 RepID=A0ABM9B4W9_9BACT|nr:TM1802 family CRISPR-associated protein [Neolewinella maritima]CAH1002434.1 hypothetical protein LEM8419_03313 [Neolewinella maritima]
MIQSLYALGQALKTNEDFAPYFASYANPFAGFDELDRAKVIVLEIKNDEVMGTDMETFSPAHAHRYLYRKPKGARGAPLVATGPFYPVHSLETEKQQETQRDNVEKIMSRIGRAIPDGKSVYFSSTAAKEVGLARINELLYNETGSKDHRYIYTLRVNDKYLGEYEELRDLLDQEAYTKYYEKSRGKAKTCALSHETDVEVWGRIDTLGFTVNDISFSRGGFDGASSFRMFPVSKDAALALEAARRYAFSNLTDRFYTLEYLIVPRMIEGSPSQLLTMARKMIKDKNDTTLAGKATPILKAGGLIDILASDETIQRSGVIFDILFYQRKQAQLALQLHLQDVAPARLVQLRNTIKQIGDRYGRAFGYRNKDKELVPFRIHFGMVKNFFSEGKGLKIRFDPAFFRILEGVFYGQPLDEATIVAALTRKIREAFKTDGDDYHLPFHTTVQQAIATRTLLGRLGLFNHTSYQIMDEPSSPITLRREAYLTEHAAFFDPQPALKGAFLLGCLTSMLAYAQYDHLRSKPFLKKLNNLNMGLDELRALSAPLLNKIQEYQGRKSGGYAPSHTETTQLLSEANSLLIEGKKPSRDDLSFAFSTGLVMQDKFGMDMARERREAKEQQEPASTE